MGPKRKRSTAAARATTAIPLPPNVSGQPPAPQRRASRRAVATSAAVNPETDDDILDGPDALRASPDAEVDENITPGRIKDESESDLSDVPLEVQDVPKGKQKKNAAAAKTKANGVATTASKKGIVDLGAGVGSDPEADEEVEEDEEEILKSVTRPPPVNSPYLPLPWKGRIGYACLNTYLRYSNPPVFCSRTCRIASILEHRHPLKDPSQPEHATKNRPDKDLPADVGRGMRYVEEIGLANARDLIKMLRWNDRYGIKFMRLSSEMFPFASHDTYGYKLAPFASEVLAEVGKVVAELGHRVTTHPGQFTQLGSPRKQVVENAFRDLEYHDEMLSLLKLPEQQNRDAVMIIHMGGIFGDKAATLARFKQNYAKLPQSVKNRLVLENDDVSWSVHDLLPVCQELNIPLVLDFHHHNIIFDSTQLREGTQDITALFPAIAATWTRKGIRQKMHYSEPTAGAVTPMKRRKHSARVATLPPCAPDMDLMIEAKDKEQAVFELMRTFKLPGFEKINDVIPHVREDDNRPPPRVKKAPTPRKRKAKKMDDGEELDEGVAAQVQAQVAEEKKPVPEEEVGMGGPDGRVYWPPGMEDWLRPKKREIKKKDPDAPVKLTPAQKRKAAAAEEAEVKGEEAPAAPPPPPAKKGKAAPVKGRRQAKAAPKDVPTPEETSADEDGDELELLDLGDEDEDVDVSASASAAKKQRKPASGSRKSARAARVSYAEAEGSE